MSCDAFTYDSSSFPEINYLIDFTETKYTVWNFRKQTKLSSSFFIKQYMVKLFLCFGSGKLIHFKIITYLF